MNAWFCFCSNAKPKIADYPFTTIVPNLGVCDLFSDYQPQSTSAADPGSSAPAAALVIADIPGLLEGAHAGVGLGMAFLRHVQRCRCVPPFFPSFVCFDDETDAFVVMLAFTCVVFLQSADPHDQREQRGPSGRLPGDPAGTAIV